MARILVVDDHPLNRDFLATLLGYGGHAIVEAGDGREALARVHELKPDLVISDILMPTMDGVEFVRALRADPDTADLKVIFYTAIYRARDAEAMARSVGVRWVLVKPAEPQRILETVAEALGTGEPIPPTAAADPSKPREAMSERLASVQELSARLAALVKGALRIAEGPEQSFEAARAMELALTGVQSLGLKLTVMLELSQEMALARDLEHMIGLCCRAAQDMLGARYAGIAITFGPHPPRLRHFTARGLDPQTCAGVAAEIAGCSLARRLRRSDRLANIAGARAGLPAAHPPVSAVLALPIRGHGADCGWLYVADRLEGGRFTGDDERIARALAAQFAIAWENRRLYAELEQRVAERRQAEEQLKESLARLRDLSQRLIEAEESERRNINRELHDRVGQDLAAVKLNIDLIRTMLPEDARRAVGVRLEDANALIQSAIDHARNIMADLRPPGLDDFGLLTALKRHALIVAQRSGVAVSVCGEDPQPRLSPIVETACFRIAQEALANVVKHAGARHAEVALAANGAAITLSVSDDGAGFDSSAETANTFGLRIMHERARAVGARLSIDSVPGRGTRVAVQVVSAG